jgi:hypothetical protein
VPHPGASDLTMDFHVHRKVAGNKTSTRIPVAQMTIRRGQWRRRHGSAPDAPLHPYGIEVRTRHLTTTGHVSWYTLVALMMDVARRGAQLADHQLDLDDRESLLYVVPRFSFIPLADATACNNLFVYPAFEVDRPWAGGKSSCAVRVTIWAVANDAPWPVVECVATVVRTLDIDGVRRPVDDLGRAKAERRTSQTASADSLPRTSRVEL